MCELKLKIIFLLTCGILYVSMLVPTKKNMVLVKKYDELKQNLKQGPPQVTTTSTNEIMKNCVCSKVYDPVCGSNGISYYNVCQLQCKSNDPGDIVIVHQGNCIPFRKH